MIFIWFSGDQNSPGIAISPIKVADQNQIDDVNENEIASISTKNAIGQNKENEKVRFKPLSVVVIMSAEKTLECSSFKPL